MPSNSFVILVQGPRYGNPGPAAGAWQRNGPALTARLLSRSYQLLTPISPRSRFFIPNLLCKIILLAIISILLCHQMIAYTRAICSQPQLLVVDVTGSKSTQIPLACEPELLAYSYISCVPHQAINQNLYTCNGDFSLVQTGVPATRVPCDKLRVQVTYPDFSKDSNEKVCYQQNVTFVQAVYKQGAEAEDLDVQIIKLDRIYEYQCKNVQSAMQSNGNDGNGIGLVVFMAPGDDFINHKTTGDQGDQGGSEKTQEKQDA